MYLQKVISKNFERKKLLFLGILSATGEESGFSEPEPDPNPDPFQNAADPQHCRRRSRRDPRIQIWTFKEFTMMLYWESTVPEMINAR
jgi:hypothetical protein